MFPQKACVKSYRLSYPTLERKTAFRKQLAYTSTLCKIQNVAMLPACNQGDVVTFLFLATSVIFN